jgi:SAM-dependent methyltransferase
MTRFAAAWLDQREPFDRAARSRALAIGFLGTIPSQACVVDLAAGTGSNAAFLAAIDPRAHRWRLVDHDDNLLAHAARRDASRADLLRLDLARQLDEALDGAHAVTAASFLDLVSQGWCERFVQIVARRRLSTLIALTFDGRIAWRPRDPDDSMLHRAFLRDMRRDKGFGPAMGAEAARILTAELRRRGGIVEVTDSRWRITPGDAAMLDAMIRGITDAAAQISAGDVPAIDAWRARRSEQCLRGELTLTVGHVDVWARWA